MKQTLRLFLPLLTLLLAPPCWAQPAEPVPGTLPYATTLPPTEVEALDGPLAEASRLRRLAGLGHQVAFDGGHHRGGLTRCVEQD